MKLKGMSIDEIASQAGLHPNSVRRIFVELSQRVDAANKRSGPFAGMS